MPTSAARSPPPPSAAPTASASSPLSAQARFVALQTDQIDLLVRNTSWTLSREAVIGVQFTGTLYHDGQAFMVPRKPATRDLAGLNGAQICVGKGTTSEAGLADYFAARKWKYTPVVLESLERAGAGLLQRQVPRVYRRPLAARGGARRGAEGRGGIRDPAAADLEGVARPGGQARRR